MINWEPTGRRVYFFEPHQDDGVLFMGQVAAHHMLAGREVHVVLMSNGSTSSALGKLNGTQQSGGWWGGWHDPAREGYEPLTPETMAAARTAEWRASWTQLGVPPERQHLGMDALDVMELPASVGGQYAADVMSHFVEQDMAAGLAAPGLYAMHWDDPNPDHAACGGALRVLRQGNPLYADSRWMAKPEEAAGAGADIYTVPGMLLPEVKLYQKRAATAYGAWAPEQGAYAIGFHSVFSPYFVQALRGDPNHIVRHP